MPFDNTPTTPRTDTAVVLDRAIELLETRGWCQGSMIDENNRLCMIGAIGVAAKHTKVSPVPTLRAVEHDLTDGVGIATWNDRPNRTMDQVLAKLREVRAAL